MMKTTKTTSNLNPNRLHHKQSNNNETGASQTIISLALGVAALIALVVFFGPEETPELAPQPTNSVDISRDSTPTPELASPSASSNAAPKVSMPNVEKFPAGAKMIVGSAENPPAELPDDLRQALENPDRELPPEMQAQLNAAPPELPEDLRRQLANQPTELPEDLQRQLNMPPPPIPDDIKKALETPPREVSLDEVNTPPSGR